MLTISEFDSSNFIGSRPYIMITARVHPSETVSSWIMQGIIKVIISKVALTHMSVSDQH